MVVAGRLVGTFEPARVMVMIAQAASTSATRKTSEPGQTGGRTFVMKGRGITPSSRMPAMMASAHAIGGRMMTFAVSVELVMGGVYPSPFRRGCPEGAGAAGGLGHC